MFLLDLDTILEYFERLSFDDFAYFVFKSESELEVCVQFDKKTLRPWMIWYSLNQDASKQCISRYHLPAVLKSFGVNSEELVNELANNLLIQAAYANEFLKQVTEILGEESVENSINQTQNFLAQLKSSVFGALEKGSKQELLTPENALAEKNKQTQANKNRLRVIR